MPTDDQLRQMARESAKEKVGFYTHLGVYVVVNLFLIRALDAYDRPRKLPLVDLRDLRLGDWGRGELYRRVPRQAYTERVAEREYRRLKGER